MNSPVIAKNNLARQSFGLAMGALTLCSVSAFARHHHHNMMDDTATAAVAVPVQPTPVTGTVAKYYVNPAGFVTALDIQTSSGVTTVDFAPSYAEQLTGSYPVGSTITVFVDGEDDLLGIGPNMPSPTAVWGWHPVSTIALLRSVPYTFVGAHERHINGHLTSYIHDREGEVLAIVLDHDILVRVPLESRQGANVDMTPDGVRPLFKGEDIEVVGYPEAPLFGSVSRYSTRLIATAIDIQGVPLGERGFGKVGTGYTSLFSFDIGGPDNDEMHKHETYTTFTSGNSVSTESAPAAASS